MICFRRVTVVMMFYLGVQMMIKVSVFCMMTLFLI